MTTSWSFASSRMRRARPAGGRRDHHRQAEQEDEGADAGQAGSGRDMPIRMLLFGDSKWERTQTTSADGPGTGHPAPEPVAEVVSDLVAFAGDCAPRRPRIPLCPLAPDPDAPTPSSLGPTQASGTSSPLRASSCDPGIPICQTDLPLDWYQDEFRPYAEEYLALPDRTPESVLPWLDRVRTSPPSSTSATPAPARPLLHGRRDREARRALRRARSRTATRSRCRPCAGPRSA